MGRGHYPKKKQHRAALSASLKGQPKSDATIEKMRAAQAKRRAFETRARDDYKQVLEDAKDDGLPVTEEYLVSRFFGLYYDVDENGELTHPFVRKLLGFGPLRDQSTS